MGGSLFNCVIIAELLSGARPRADTHKLCQKGILTEPLP